MSLDIAKYHWWGWEWWQRGKIAPVENHGLKALQQEQSSKFQVVQFQKKDLPGKQASKHLSLNWKIPKRSKSLQLLVFSSMFSNAGSLKNVGKYFKFSISKKEKLLVKLVRKHQKQSCSFDWSILGTKASVQGLGFLRKCLEGIQVTKENYFEVPFSVLKMSLLIQKIYTSSQNCRGATKSVVFIKCQKNASKAFEFTS